MFESRTITSADAKMLLVAVGVFDSPVPIEGFSTDSMWTSDAKQTGEFQMGADGKLSAGFVFAPTRISVTLQADSQSIDFFDTIAQTQQQRKKLIEIRGVVAIPAIRKKFALQKFYMENWQPLPTAGRVLAPRPFALIGESCTWSYT